MVGGGERLRIARLLLPEAVEKAKAAKGFPGRWSVIISKLAHLPPCLSDLSSHPCFGRNVLCGELLRSACEILEEIINLAENCGTGEASVGKLRMQSELDAVAGKMELILRDFGLLIRTGVLAESSPPSSPSNLGEILSRIQIGDSEAKDRAFDGLLEAMKEDPAAVVEALSRGSVSALVQQLTAPSPRLREKAASAVCFLAETATCHRTLVAEGVVPPLIRLAESASLACREKAAVALERLSVEADTARAIVSHGGLRPLMGICRGGASASCAASAGALRNISAIAELRRALSEEGAVKLAVELLKSGEAEQRTKSLAAEWLRNLTSGAENFKRAAAAEGAAVVLLGLLEVPSPEEPPVGALRNLAGFVSSEEMLSLGLIPRLAHVLRAGSLEARAAAASAVCKFCTRREARRSAGACGLLSPLVAMLEGKVAWAREAAAQALLCLMSCSQNVEAVKKDSRSVPHLVQLLDPGPQNTAKKYAVPCLLLLCGSKKCRRVMVSYGAIGYLKKLSDADAPGSKSLLQRLQSQGLESFFLRK
ncbi:uncharacterized protein LOC144716631 [Wolffia australiana]